jgi:hypothetical protein
LPIICQNLRFLKSEMEKYKMSTSKWTHYIPTYVPTVYFPCASLIYNNLKRLGYHHTPNMGEKRQK